MIIKITGKLGETKTEPERAEVETGEPVQWSIEVTGGSRRVPYVLWEVYFERESPFRERSWRVTSELREPRRRRWRDKRKAMHKANIEAGQANEPGEYKYGVRAFAGSSPELVSDDDPLIIVRRRTRG
jgi:hypothetical protein